MAKMTLEEVREVVRELTPEDRELLYLDLSDEMEKVDPEAEKAWKEEIRRRVQSIKDGTAVLYDGDEVLAEVEAMLHAQA